MITVTLVTMRVFRADHHHILWDGGRRSRNHQAKREAEGSARTLRVVKVARFKTSDRPQEMGVKLQGSAVRMISDINYG